MEVTDNQIAALRSYLAPKPKEMERMHQELVQTGAEGYGEFVYAAFVAAVRRRFGQTWSIPEVVRLVATFRVKLSKDGFDIDPHAAEIQVRRALGDYTHSGADETARARAQLSLLGELIHDEHFNDSALDEFIAEARTLAERTFS